MPDSAREPSPANGNCPPWESSVHPRPPSGTKRHEPPNLLVGELAELGQFGEQGQRLANRGVHELGEGLFRFGRLEA